ncbi:hypothetical protein SNB56_00600, partial [Escherichia coli]|nr:hypothetical protein [Escherichia coli]MEA0883662.1 hypothetical protein [Escherichia coli]
GKKLAQIREILISESTWEEMTCLFAPSLTLTGFCNKPHLFFRELKNITKFCLILHFIEIVCFSSKASLSI